jgi:hypothetical protein
MVTILVGKDETPFILHQTPLIHKSPVFWADLAAETEEDDDEDPVRLLGIEARYFKVYAHWIYSSQLDIAFSGFPPGSQEIGRSVLHDLALSDASDSTRDPYQNKYDYLCKITTTLFLYV